MPCESFMWGNARIFFFFCNRRERGRSSQVKHSVFEIQIGYLFLPTFFGGGGPQTIAEKSVELSATESQKKKKKKKKWRHLTLYSHNCPS